MTAKEFLREKKRLLESIKESLYISRELERAFLEIPREEFVLPQHRKIAYADVALPLLKGQTISQPYTVLFMLSYLDVKKNNKVLEIGTGSGYNAALLSKLAKKVFTIDVVPELCEYAKQRIKKLKIKNIKLFCMDGSKGLPEKAPFDRIIVTASAQKPVTELKKQLKKNGVLIVPEGPSFMCQMKKYTKISENKFKEENLGFFSFVPLV